jgi:hypothetical protein
MAIRFEKKTDDTAGKTDKKVKEAANKGAITIDSDTYASLQKPEKKEKKKRF